MRKAISIILVCIMLIGAMSIIAVANDLDELIGLEIRVWYAGNFNRLSCRGILLEIRGDWLIVFVDKKKYTWCYIPTIRGIDILNKDYKPSRKVK